MKDLKNATVYLKIALGSNMNVSSLTPLAITEIMEDYHQDQLKLLNISGVSKSLTTEEKEIEDIVKPLRGRDIGKKLKGEW